MMTRGEEMRLQHLSEVKTLRKRINGLWNSNDDRNGRVRKGKERERNKAMYNIGSLEFSKTEH